MVSMKILLFVIITINYEYCSANNTTNSLEMKLEDSFSELVNRFTKWLEDFNDRHLGDSDMGRLFRYKMLKPKFGNTGREGKGLKKMSMAMLPLVFHVGAASTWMLVTSIMAVKSVAIGLLLLVFKIAVSSAKVASFFTALKSKTHHHEWAWSPPHSEHHGHFRSLKESLLGHQVDWSSYVPEDVQPYKTIPVYKHNEHDITPFDVPEFEEPKKGRR